MFIHFAVSLWAWSSVAVCIHKSFSKAFLWPNIDLSLYAFLETVVRNRTIQNREYFPFEPQSFPYSFLPYLSLQDREPTTLAILDQAA